MPYKVPSLDKRASINGIYWEQRVINDEVLSYFPKENQTNETLNKILSGRNVSIENYEEFLDPEVNKLINDPSELIDLDKAVDVLTAAIKNKSKIGIIGDYDVDGTTSAALLKKFLGHYNIESSVYIPDRLKDGYGPNIPSFKDFKESGIDTVITVDCGATSIEAMEYAHENDIDVIIIDHHKVDGKLPKCIAHINPTRENDDSKLNHLAAIGLTFLFVVGLRRSLRQVEEFKSQSEPNLKKYLDIVALGTICDVVQLKDLNRAFVKEGINVINDTDKVGIKSLCSVANINQIGVYELGYVLGPRINAAGRTGSPDLGLRLLTSDNKDEVEAIAEKLNDLNKKRQTIEKRVLEESISKVEKFKNDNNLNTYPSSLFVEEDNWHLGVLGIVASRLKEKYNRPSFVISTDNGISTGSSRSLPGIDIGKIIIDGVNEGLLLKGGGHAMAGGFSLKKGNIQEFNKFCDKRINELNSELLTKRIQKYDSILDSVDINRNFFNIIDKASPYGQGNPEPKFVLPNVEIEFCKIVGNGHLKLRISSSNYSNLDAIAFNVIGTPLGDLISNHSGSLIHFVGTVRKNDWQDLKSVQFHIYDAFIA